MKFDDHEFGLIGVTNVRTRVVGYFVSIIRTHLDAGYVVSCPSVVKFEFVFTFNV